MRLFSQTTPSCSKGTIGNLKVWSQLFFVSEACCQRWSADRHWQQVLVWLLSRAGMFHSRQTLRVWLDVSANISLCCLIKFELYHTGTFLLWVTWYYCDVRRLMGSSTHQSILWTGSFPPTLTYKKANVWILAFQLTCLFCFWYCYLYLYNNDWLMLPLPDLWISKLEAYLSERHQQLLGELSPYTWKPNSWVYFLWIGGVLLICSFSLSAIFSLMYEMIHGEAHWFVFSYYFICRV